LKICAVEQVSSTWNLNFSNFARVLSKKKTMRPGSGMGGVPPGTGLRPGSGRKPPGTGRLRTGFAAGPGTEAATGVAISANVNVTDRPMTGQGVKGMKVQGGGGRLVEDTSYYVGLLRKKITDVTNETRALNQESEQHSKEGAQYSQLEKRYETLIKSKESLEGQLADYNLALDKTRNYTDPDDVQQMAIHLV
jgi:intraflagellar transport protein 74